MKTSKLIKVVSGRLEEANCAADELGSWTGNGALYDTEYGYGDKNGNLAHIERNAEKGGRHQKHANGLGTILSIPGGRLLLRNEGCAMIRDQPVVRAYLSIFL